MALRTLLVLCILTPGAASAAAVNCRTLESRSEFYVGAAPVSKIGGPTWEPAGPSRELGLPQIARYSCDRFIGQFQGLGWDGAKACQGLLDERKIDSSGQAYFDGPHDPSRCMATVHLRNFKQRLRSFLASSLKRWTPNLSRELLFNAKATRASGLASSFVCTEYRQILKTRDPSTLRFPGPAGEKLPRDLALLWLAWAPDQPKQATSSGILGTGDPFQDSGPYKDIISLYGSLDAYKALLRKSLKDDILGTP